MDPYNPAKYALRAPPPIPPRPGAAAPIPSPRNDGLGPPLPPRPTSTLQAFPPPPRRHVQQGTQPPSYQQAYHPGQYGSPPPQMTSHYASPQAAPQNPFPSSQQSNSPAPSAYQSPPYYAPAPPTAQVPSSPQVPSYGASAMGARYVSREDYAQPSYHPPAAPGYPPPPTNPVVQSYGAPAVQQNSAQRSTIHAQAHHASQPPSYHAPPPVSTPATAAAMAPYPPPPTSPQINTYVAPDMRSASTYQGTAQTQGQSAQPPSYLPSPSLFAPSVPTYPPPPNHQDTDYGPPPMTANSGGYEGNQVKPSLAQLSAHYFPPATSATSSPPYMSSPQASDEAPATADQYGAGAAVVSPPPPSPQDANYGPPVSSGGSEGNQTKPSLAQLSANYFPPVTKPTYHEPYTASSQAPDEPHVTAERYAIGTPMKPYPAPTSSPYQPEPGAFVNYLPPSYEPPQVPPPPAGPRSPSKSRSGIESLTESMAHIRIDPRAEAPGHQHQQFQPRSKTPPRPPIQHNAPAKFTLRQCPSTEYTFSGKSQWYIHPQVPDFRICLYCYEKHIQISQFESEFHSWTSPDGSSPQCLFSCPRIEDNMWPRAVHSGDLRELLQLFERRLSIPNCPRQRGVPATESMKWYQPRDKQKFPGFLACQACYEDVLLSGALRNEFVMFTGTQAKETLFICDAANLYVRKLATKTSSMDTFIPEVIRHLRLPECEKNGALSDGPSRKWYQPRNQSSNSITICERCFGEYVAHTEFDTHFQPIARPKKQHRCMLGLWQSRSVLDEALANHDFPLWERTIFEVNNTPLCTVEIARGVPVYQIPGIENFDVCHACYVGLLKPFGMDRFFERVRDPVYGRCACDLNAGTPRIAPFAKKLDEAMITATFGSFATFAARFSTTDMCPKLNLVSGRQWYGNESCRICPACYEEVVRDSYLAKQGYFPPTPMTLTEETVCDLYSPRMRSKLNTACSTQDTDSFLTFATHRKNIYTQTVPEMRALVARSKHNLSMQKMYNTTSSAYNNMDGMGMYDTGIRYTGSGVSGVFRTHWGVEGAAMGQTAMGYMQQSQADATRVRYLQGIWDGVE